MNPNETRYRTYKGLPEVAGICSLAEAAAPGLSVNDCVERLKRYHYALHRLWEIFNARLTAEPVYEIKMAFSLHGHLCAQHVSAVRDRVAEMRHPPLGLDKIPHDALRLFFDEIRSAPATYDVLAGVYGRALPALRRGLERHLRDTNRLADWPTVRVVRFALTEVDEMLAWGSKALECLADEPRSENLQAWLDALEACLRRAGGLDGADPDASVNAPFAATSPLPRFSAEPFRYARTPRRDARFPDPYNMGVHAEEFLYNPDFPASAKTLMMYFKRLREIDVPEMMASILVESPEKPWEFHRDMTRQLWDEARHAMMGEAGFVKLGLDWAKLVPVNFTWSKGLNEQLKPEERHAVLWFIEQGLMSKTGKRYEWEVGRESGDPTSELYQDYDWADEVLHARIGREWYVSRFADDVEKAAEYGSACWSRVVSDWAAWREQGLTQHRNWWPELYAEFCRRRGTEPDPAALAFRTSYAETRADLQRIAASG
ncbi:MAG: hypothetical protein JNL97_17670 [Verrucomicrobiales bacterium]|nr:hypothetical protein [Verrucomicrobiales bacterium]